jgi:hypothetical protein
MYSVPDLLVLEVPPVISKYVTENGLKDMMIF